jgi:acyl-CoA dehydrogenase
MRSDETKLYTGGGGMNGTDIESQLAELKSFMSERILPNEARIEAELLAGSTSKALSETAEALKSEAKKTGLWNLFLHDKGSGKGLSNVEYSTFCEEMGQSLVAPEIFNCSAPDTGNMETLLRYGSESQKERWLKPLLAGEIRSCFAMTEPEVASSDATNIACRIVRDGDSYSIDGRKWWTTGALHPNCKVAIVMGKTDTSAASHKQQTMILVPMDTPGVSVVRHLTVFGYDDRPQGHGEVIFSNVRVPAENVLLGEGRGFEIAQGRLGPGRIHHCMRLIGLAERAMRTMVLRARTRTAFGSALSEKGAVRRDIAISRIEIDQARLLTQHAARRMDEVGAKGARNEISMIKFVAPNVACRVIDRAIQVHGAAGVSQDTFLARAYAKARSVRIVDGPDDVHLESIAKREIAATNLAGPA